MTRRALTFAGLDVSGGAGLSADLKMFEEYGVFGSTVETCIVTFNPDKEFVHEIEFVAEDIVARQLTSVLGVHSFDVIKSGMLGSVDNALVLADHIEKAHIPYVFDPVLVCKGAGTMVDLKDLFLDKLVPHATVITPNLEEAATLVGTESLNSVEDMVEAARTLHSKGAQNVIVKGGARLDGPTAVDVIFDGTTVTELSTTKVNNHLVNGAGCSFASSIAAGLATGLDVVAAATSAKEKIAHGIAASIENATGVRSLLHCAWRTQPTDSITVETRTL